MSETVWKQICDVRMSDRFISWVIPKSGGVALCVRQDDLSHYLGDATVLRAWQPQFEDAIRNGLRGLRMISGSFIPYTPEQCDALLLSPYLSPPVGYKTCPTFPASELQNLKTPFFPPRGGVSLVLHGGREYIYKSLDAPRYARQGGLEELQNELDTNFLVRESPYVLPIAALISQVSYQVFHTADEDPRPTITPQAVIRGFLVPFMGATSRLWYPFEWSVDEKLALTAGLIRAVAAIESLGVNLTDLKQANVLLTLEGIKLIDLNTITYSKGYYDDSGQRQVGTSSYTLYNLGKTIIELFTERQPPPESARLPKSVTRLVLSSIGYQSGTTSVRSVNELLSVFDSRISSWDGLRTLPDLDAKRYERLQAMSQNPDQSWYGMVGAEVWTPNFTAWNGFRSIMVRTREALLGY